MKPAELESLGKGNPLGDRDEHTEEENYNGDAAGGRRFKNLSNKRPSSWDEEDHGTTNIEESIVQNMDVKAPEAKLRFNKKRKSEIVDEDGDNSVSIASIAERVTPQEKVSATKPKSEPIADSSAGEVNKVQKSKEKKSREIAADDDQGGKYSSDSSAKKKPDSSAPNRKAVYGSITDEADRRDQSKSRRAAEDNDFGDDEYSSDPSVKAAAPKKKLSVSAPKAKAASCALDAKRSCTVLTAPGCPEALPLPLPSRKPGRAAKVIDDIFAASAPSPPVPKHKPAKPSSLNEELLPPGRAPSVGTGARSESEASGSGFSIPKKRAPTWEEATRSRNARRTAEKEARIAAAESRSGGDSDEDSDEDAEDADRGPLTAQRIAEQNERFAMEAPLGPHFQKLKDALNMADRAVRVLRTQAFKVPTPSRRHLYALAETKMASIARGLPLASGYAGDYVYRSLSAKARNQLPYDPLDVVKAVAAARKFDTGSSFSIESLDPCLYEAFSVEFGKFLVNFVAENPFHPAIIDLAGRLADEGSRAAVLATLEKAAASRGPVGYSFGPRASFPSNVKPALSFDGQKDNHAKASHLFVPCNPAIANASKGSPKVHVMFRRLDAQVVGVELGNLELLALAEKLVVGGSHETKLKYVGWPYELLVIDGTTDAKGPCSVRPIISIIQDKGISAFKKNANLVVSHDLGVRLGQHYIVTQYAPGPEGYTNERSGSIKELVESQPELGMHDGTLRAYLNSHESLENARILQYGKVFSKHYVTGSPKFIMDELNRLEGRSEARGDLLKPVVPIARQTLFVGPQKLTRAEAESIWDEKLGQPKTHVPVVEWVLTYKGGKDRSQDGLIPTGRFGMKKYLDKAVVDMSALAYHLQGDRKRRLMGGGFVYGHFFLDGDLSPAERLAAYNDAIGRQGEARIEPRDLITNQNNALGKERSRTSRKDSDEDDSDTDA
ncbi:hypothetical protein DFJ74DRAFT_358352 [Hyaloraphidium curvatum]|nr:hypothetical protein DFJ74DRAFT_358352 [Hyaloraphidium curvatum]